MKFKNSVIDLIKIRKSIRNYESSKIKDEDRDRIIGYINEDHKTIFGCKLRFDYIDASDLDPDDLKDLGTHGMISGARYFIAGMIKKDIKQDQCLVDFGYIFEKMLLFVTDLGLGTCWLGGTYNKKGFSEKIILNNDEILAAVSPVGIISEKRSLKSSMIRAFAGSKNRKPWDKLFFSGSFLNPLEESFSGYYKEPLEMIRLAPSASNLQPWRILKEKDKDVFHFFIKKAKHYQRVTGLNLQYMDIGISLCHFELAASELNLKGKWEVIGGIQENREYGMPSNVDYIVSCNGA